MTFYPSLRLHLSDVTPLLYPSSVLETVIESSGIPPFISPKSPTGLHSKVGAKPFLHLQENEPAVLTHSVDARSHWLLTHSLISTKKKLIRQC